ncbi:MAG: ABC transporter permease [Chloroflexi bacterium]|nr:ABC transporter permease [Chloroflexota bacterium]
MRVQLLFYVRHALRSLQRERRRSLFAVFAIAVGVAAVVGLQTLSLSIGDSVTEDIQATHQGDIVVSTRNGEPFPQEHMAALDALVSRMDPADSAWFLLPNPDRPSFIAPAGEASVLQWFQPYLVEPDNYPLYGELASIEPKDVPVRQLLNSPGDVVLAKGIASRLGVSVGDRVVIENSGTFEITGLVSNQASGGVFAPYFVPPMPWFAYMDVKDPTARETFKVEGNQASVLFVKTRTDAEAQTLARDIEATIWLVERGALDDRPDGNVFVYLPAPTVDLGDRVRREIESLTGVANVVEYHVFSDAKLLLPRGRQGPTEGGLVQTLIAAEPMPAAVEMAHGRDLGPGDKGSPVMVMGGFEALLGESAAGQLGSRRDIAVNGRTVTLEVVGVTAGDLPVQDAIGESALLAPLGAIDPSIPRSSISFLLTVPETDASDAAARLARAFPGIVAVRADSPAAIVAARDFILGDGSPIEVETAAARLPEIEDTTDVLGKVIIVAGLVSLAIGGIGILNTMLVVVGRRTQEIGVLKALGLKGRQVTLLFMIEGLVLGVAGSVVGILVGIALSIALTGVGEQFLQVDVGWKLQVAPIYTGLVVGIVATTVFGFLPTLAASQVRPNVVLQSQGTAVPRTGRLVSLLVVIVLTAVMGLVATVFLSNPVVGLAGAYGALAVLAVLTIVLIGLVWVVGKSPSFGSINLKLALRGMSRQKGRAASTLLALVIGIFAMASIVMLGDTLKDLADEISEDAVGGNVLLMIPQADVLTIQRASEAVSSLNSINNVVEDHQYEDARIVAVNGETGRRWGSTMVARRGVPEQGPPSLSEGRLLEPSDEGKAVVVVGSGVAEDLSLEIGDTLTFDIGAHRVNGELVGGRETDLELVGITVEEWPATGGFSDDGGFIIPIGGLDSLFTPTNAFFIMTADESDGPAIAEELTRAVPGAIAMETRTVAGVFKDILDRIAVFPMVLSALALFAGAVIIANSVALATMERRRKIATMKAVGAKGSRILTALLLENAIIGFLGGAIGVALSMIVLVVMNRLESDIPISPNPVSVALVLVVAIGVALGAAVISAWPASKEKPLTVLRYE